MQLRPLKWSEILVAVKNVGERLAGSDVDVVVGIERGGVLPSALVASYLHLDDIRFVEIRRYSDDKPPRPIADEPIIYRSDVGDLKDKTVLLVDDIARTGSTMRIAEKHLLSLGASRVIKAVLVLKAEARYLPEAYGVMLDTCPIFPWEVARTSGNRPG